MAICWSARQKSWQINPDIITEKKEGQSTSVRSSFLFPMSLTTGSDHDMIDLPAHHSKK